MAARGGGRGRRDALDRGLLVSDEERLELVLRQGREPGREVGLGVGHAADGIEGYGAANRRADWRRGKGRCVCEVSKPKAFEGSSRGGGGPGRWSSFTFVVRPDDKIASDCDSIKTP